MITKNTHVLSPSMNYSITVNEHITVTDDRVIPTLEGLFYGQIATLSVCIYI